MRNDRYDENLKVSYQKNEANLINCQKHQEALQHQFC